MLRRALSVTVLVVSLVAMLLCFRKVDDFTLNGAASVVLLDGDRSMLVEHEEEFVRRDRVLLDPRHMVGLVLAHGSEMVRLRPGETHGPVAWAPTVEEYEAQLVR